MYMRQLKTTDAMVVIIPPTVLRQVIVSITEDGQSMYSRSVLPILKMPHTPKKRRTRTATDTTSPTPPPISAACRVVMISLLFC